MTGDTLGDKSAPIQYPRVKLPEPAITFAIEPKSRADEDKLGPGIHKLMEEDGMDTAGRVERFRRKYAKAEPAKK